MKPEDFPIRLSTGETIASPEALSQCKATKAARYILKRIEELENRENL